ncbi:hypothetical protein B0H13DRAFT_2660339 [Mycena leptocephala]|nr:hypothetical protein B0H13DRAFT_2660339 [Mycena leptocephala]
MATQSQRPGSTDDFPARSTADKSDKDLLEAHQHKVDVRLEEIEASLEDLEQKIAATDRRTEDITERRAAEVRRRNDWRLTNLQLAGNRLTGWDSNDVGEGWPWPEDVSRWNDYGLDFDTTVPAAISPVELDQLQREMLRLPNVRRRLAARRLALLRERKAITHQITLAAFASSPMRRIPADVLLEIFKVLKSIVDGVKTPKTQNDDGKVTESPEINSVGHDVGTILSKVCSGWRAVACDYPRLWSSFSFSLFSKGSADLVEVYLERSRSRPLTIEINTQTYTQGRSSQRAIDLLADHSHHLLELRVFTGLRIGDTIPALPSFQPLRGNLPYLELLQIPVWSSLANEFEFVPRLHTLRLCGLQELTETDHKFDRTQIRSLTLRDASGHQLLQYPNVTDLTCVESSAERLHQSIPTATPPVLTGLKAWKIEFTRDEKATFGAYDAWGISNIFRRFNMPALHSLDVQFRGDAAELTGFLRRSRCNLRALVLRDCNIRIGALLQILELTPDLESFTAIGGHSTMITDRLFQYLTVRPDMSTNLAKLSSLTLTGSFAFGVLALVQMLESRTPEAARSNGTYVCLNDIFLSFPGHVVPATLLERLRGLDGTTVYLECLNSGKVMYRPF